MGHNAFIRAGGGVGVWNNGSAVTPAEFSAFDNAQYSAIHEGGGTWSAASVIVIGGLGINITGPSVLDDITGSTITGDVTILAGGYIQVNDNASIALNGDLAFGATGTLVAVSGSSCTWNSGATFNCTANATFNGTLTLTTTADIALGSASVTRVQEGTPWASSSNWVPGSFGVASNAATGTTVYLPLDIPNGATLTSVTVYAIGAPAHVALPAVMPAYSVLVGATDGSSSTLGAAIDASGTTAAFQANHATTLAVSAVTDRAAKRYFIEYTAESGANSLVGLKINSWTATYTVTKYDRGVG